MAIYGSTFFNCSLDANRETLVFLKNSNPDHKKNLSTEEQVFQSIDLQSFF